MSKEDSSVTTSKKKGKKAVYIYRFLDKMNEEDVTLDDVFNGLSLSFVEITERRQYNLHLMRCLTDQFAKGVAKNTLVSFQTFKMAVKALETARKTTDIRTMPAFWPYFRQLFIHVKPEHLNESIEHFISNKELLDTGRLSQKVKTMVDSYIGFSEEFKTVQDFIIYGNIFDFDNDVLEKCRQLSFCLMLNPKKGIKALTIAALRSDEARENLIKFFHIVPAFLKHKIQYNKTQEPLAVGLIRHILENEISIMLMQEKVEFLERLIKGIINESILGENKGYFPLSVFSIQSFSESLLNFENLKFFSKPPILEIDVFADLLLPTEDNTIKLKAQYGCFLKYRDH
uniref:Edg1 TPR repeats region domain-containing protein n=1 Tax=Meloidogyne enterolobii TaxID=390850 RepID=A0A6V7VPV5_MELEN|nr:unnamed protein product [Meloidogyne enterolobii]